jgi:pyruvate kinase
MEYEIIATIGPASRQSDVLAAMIASGVTALRINTSHLSIEELGEWLGDITKRDDGGGLPIVVDLQGSKWRLGACDRVRLSQGERVSLVCSGNSRRAGELPVPHEDFFRAANLSDGTIVLNDAKVTLEMERNEPHRVETIVTRGGEVSAFKGITLPRSRFRKESLSEKDAEVIARTRRLSHLRYALSYVKDAEEMQNYRSLIGRELHLIAKLERPDAIGQAAEIAQSADELWLCRGDLGAEMGLRDMARAAHEFSTQVPSLAVPVMLAGQVLEHMTEHETPTRAEVCALFDALSAGYRGVVLSDETAIGRFPVDSSRVAALFV